MTFPDYLTQKNIDAAAFERAEPALYAEWQRLFDQVHPESFTLQKKFFINDVRRRYQRQATLRREGA
jgi:hypothetical protein